MLQVCRRTLASQRGPRCTDDGPGVLLRACFRHALVAWRGAATVAPRAGHAPAGARPARRLAAAVYSSTTRCEFGVDRHAFLPDFSMQS